MKNWIAPTEKLLDLTADAEGTLHSIMKLVSEEDSLLGLLWDGVVAQSMPEEVTLEEVKEALTSLRDELTLILETMRDQKKAK